MLDGYDGQAIIQFKLSILSPDSIYTFDLQIAEVDQLFLYQVNISNVAKIDKYDEFIAYADPNDSLPSWLYFNASDLSFIGTPTMNDLSDNIIIGTSSNGAKVIELLFQLKVNSIPDIQE